MLSLKSWSVVCTLGASALLGCTHSASLPATATTKPSATLQSHSWQLQQVQTAQGVIDHQWQLSAVNNNTTRNVVLHFSDQQTLSVDRLCNVINGSYRTEGQQMQVSRMISTMMACSNPSLMKLEQNVAQQLPKVRRWNITNDSTPILQLEFESGSTWQLQGSPTHETLYGRSEQIFLEVAPHTAACNNPLIANSQCLQVREIKYNDKGIKESSGTWTPYYSTIEGYAHQPGVRNVLRVKRFKPEPTPADSSKYVDVLEMTVESEIVR